MPEQVPLGRADRPRTVTLTAIAIMALLGLGLPSPTGGAYPTASITPVRSAPASVPTPAAPTPVVTDADLEKLRARALLFPVPAVPPADVAASFADIRRDGIHEALDIPAPRGAPVVAVDDGVVAKLFHSVPGGLTVYLFDRDRGFAYYYAHLDGYAPNLHETQPVRRGDVIGYVGSSGDAAAGSPHLHFAIFKLETEPRWWRGTAIDPHPLLVPPR